MFAESFKITANAVAQIIILGAIGYFFVKKEILGEGGLDVLSRLIVEAILPIFIFCQLIEGFRFDLYPNWWIFPLLSLAVTVAGFLLGYLFSLFIRGPHHKVQFMSLVSFQNSGYIPIALAAALLPKEKADVFLIYLFLFLIGFNLVIWSFGVYMLSFHERKKFEMGAMFSPPAVAALLSLAIIFFGLNRFLPETLMKPLKMVGDCTLPLAMFVVGGSLALIRLRHIDKKAVSLIILAKLLILPAAGLWLVVALKLPELIGLLIVMELAVPSATTLSVILRHYKKEDLLISQGIFYSHIAGLITLPLFLSLYLALVMIK